VLGLHTYRYIAPRSIQGGPKPDITTADSLAIASAVAGSGGDRSAPAYSSAPTMSSSGQENLGSNSVQEIDVVAESITSSAASLGGILTAVNVASTVSDVVFAANVFDFVTAAASVDFAGNAQRAGVAQQTGGALPMKDAHLRAADVNVSVSTSAVPSDSAASVVLQTCERAIGPGVHTATNQAYDSEVSAYFRDGDSPQPLTAFRYLSPVRAT